MYKVLVVDDKEIERKGISFLISEYRLPLEVTMASSGQEALEILRTTPMDILFTDIRMPSGDGLWLANQTREIDPNIVLIFFSAYSDFDYARQAIGLGAFRYLLKPIDITEFLQVMQSAIEMVEKTKGPAVAQTMPETWLLDSLFAKGTRRAHAAKRLQEYCDVSQSRLLLISFSENFFERRPEDVQQMIRKYLPAALVNVVLDDRRLLSLIGKDPFDSLMGRCNSLKVALEAAYGEFPLLVVSSIINGTDDLRSAFEEMENTSEMGIFLESGGLMEVGGSLPDMRPEMLERILDEARLRIKNGEQSGLVEIVDALFAFFRAQGSLSIIYTKYLCAQLVTQMISDINNREDQTRQVERVFKAESIAMLEALLKDIIATHAEADTGQGQVVEKVLSIIHDHYMDDITVDSLARQVFISANYLGRLFKRAQGTALSKYITSYRLEQAKKLLQKSQLKISEVAHACGYHDYSYFSMMFRTYFGISPTQFRQQSGFKEEGYVEN